MEQQIYREPEDAIPTRPSDAERLTLTDLGATNIGRVDKPEELHRELHKIQVRNTTPQQGETPPYDYDTQDPVLSKSMRPYDHTTDSGGEQPSDQVATQQEQFDKVVPVDFAPKETSPDGDEPIAA